METKQHANKGQASTAAILAVNRVVAADKWMVLAFKVEDGRVVLDDRTTWDFPSGEFGLALMIAAARLLEEKERLDGAKPTEPEPLRMAEFAKGREGLTVPVMDRTEEDESHSAMAEEMAREDSMYYTAAPLQPVDDENTVTVEGRYATDEDVLGAQQDANDEPEESQHHAEPPPDNPAD